MNKNQKKIVNDVLSCAYSKLYSGGGKCAGILSCQCPSSISSGHPDMLEISEFHVPEPWNGKIDKAQAVFVGLNPGLDHDELFPRFGNRSWGIDLTANGTLQYDVPNVYDFFENRFSKYADRSLSDPNHFYIKLENGDYKKKVHGYWPRIHRIATALLSRPVVPGEDYALTEMILCKSVNTKGGVLNKYTRCDCSKHFNRIMAEAKSCKYIVTLGVDSAEAILDFFSVKIDPLLNQVVPVSLNGRKVTLVLLPYRDQGEDKLKDIVDKCHQIEK